MGRGHSGRSRGRGGMSRGGGPRGGGGGGRGRGGGRGFGRGGGGRGRGGFRRGSEGNQTSMSRKGAEHMSEFGEQHPSEDPQNFSPHLPKRGRFDDRNSRGKWNRGYGHSKAKDETYEVSSESEEESTPYDQLLAIYSNGKNSKKEVQIVSESETDDEEDIDEKGTDDEPEQTEDPEESIDEDDDEQEQNSEGESEDSVAEELDDNVNLEDESEDDEEIKYLKMKVKSYKNLQSDVHSDEDETEIDKSKNKGVQKKIENILDSDTENDIDNEEETVIEDAEIDPELNDEISTGLTDPFVQHFEVEIDEIIQQELKKEKPYGTQILREWPIIEKFQYSGLSYNFQATNSLNQEKLYLAESSTTRKKVNVEPPSAKPAKDNSLKSLHVKNQLHANLSSVNQPIIDKESCSTPLSPLQTEVISLLTNYHDIYYTERSSQNSDALRIAYCLHAANHVWKTRNRIIHHNAKMANKIDVPDDFRDQGFVRPKVLILAPFKDSALKIIQTLVSIILSDQKGMVANKKRFNEEYGGTTLFLPKTNPKPDDYGDIFGGNCDDNYKIGLAITKKSVKLYTGFYSSDIIVASPLGLRMIIGAEGEKDRDYDFLSSIELLILDQSDIFLMQNWDHVLHIMKHMHLQPITTHGTDFARIRPWAVDGLTKYYCQTVILSSFMCPEHNALFSRYCRNYSGCVKVINPVSKGSICRVTVQLPQVFQQFDCDSLQSMDNDRFKFFLDKVLPNFKDRLMSHTLIFVSSYFDFVRLRNHFKREEVSFVQICEYTKDKKIARARDLFYHNQNHFMVYTERAHFFRRFRLKGIGHIIFYQLPQYPHFYSELCDFIQEGFQNRRVRLRKNSSVNVIYCKFDAPRLSAVVGTERAAHMIASDKKVHAFVSGEL